MTFKKLKTRTVVIEPLTDRTICHNKRCRRKLDRFQLLGGFEPNYESPICLVCSDLVMKQGFTYKGEHIEIRRIRDRRTV